MKLEEHELDILELHIMDMCENDIHRGKLAAYAVVKDRYTLSEWVTLTADPGQKEAAEKINRFLDEYYKRYDNVDDAI